MNSRTEPNPGLGSSGDKEKPATNKPTMQEIRGLDRKKLLEWIKESILLDSEDEEKFSNAKINGKVFLNHPGDIEFFKSANLPIGVSDELAELASEAIGKVTIGAKSKSYLSRHADVQLTTSQGRANKRSRLTPPLKERV
jgi:hypothetical protein